MHLVIQSHLNDYRSQYQSQKKDDTLLEAFVNYSILRQFTGDNIEPDDLIFDGDDPGIDGVFIIADDTLITTLDDLRSFFEKRHKDVPVSIVFTQVKSSENWKKSEINNFHVGVIDFLNKKPKLPLSESLLESHEIFFELFRYIGKISDGRPRVYSYYSTTGREPIEKEIISAKDIIAQSLEETGFFSMVQSHLLDRDRLTKLWLSAGGAVEARIQTIGVAAFPATPGMEASYVATVAAKDLISNILCDDSGKLRQRIFDENVRDYIGSDNEVNLEIAKTLNDPEKQMRFGVMNNGVTIVSPDVRVQGVEIFLKDFQIINGCQTSNVLFENRGAIGDQTNLMIKVVHAKEPLFIEDIVKSTNRQSKVQDEQFLATIDAIKAIERYFASRQEPEDQKIYFERRKNQYFGRGIPAIRIFDVKHLARCVGAMFLDRPDLSSRYPNRLTGEMQEAVFSAQYIEEIYHTAAFAYYRIFLLFSNQKLEQKYSNLKWHLLMALKTYFADGKVQLNDRRVRKLCDDIYKLVSSPAQNDIEFLNTLCLTISDGQQFSRDQLRNQSLLQEMSLKVASLKNK